MHRSLYTLGWRPCVPGTRQVLSIPCLSGSSYLTTGDRGRGPLLRICWLAWWVVTWSETLAVFTFSHGGRRESRNQGPSLHYRGDTVCCRCKRKGIFPQTPRVCAIDLSPLFVGHLCDKLNENREADLFKRFRATYLEFLFRKIFVFYEKINEKTKDVFEDKERPVKSVGIYLPLLNMYPAFFDMRVMAAEFDLLFTSLWVSHKNH